MQHAQSVSLSIRSLRSAAALAALFIVNPGAAMETTNTAATIQEQRIDDSAQQALAVTIYNDNLALVKDLRELTLTQGENRLAWRNCSGQIRPETALLSATSGTAAVTLLEQNFDFDLLTPQSLLKKYVGRKVQAIRTADDGARTTEDATVLATNDGVVLRYADRIETDIVGHLAFPDLPPDLRDQPTLILHLEAAQAGTGTFELSYLTGGLSWKADYVADLAADGKSMDLSGWVTLTNSSGVAYRQAKLQLVAGEVNQVRPEPPPLMMARTMAMPAAAPMPQEEALDEYHLYTLSRPTDVLNNQTKQVALLSAPRVPVTRELVVRGQPYSYQSQSADGWNKLPVASTLNFNNQGGSLGIPLPEGVVRVYSKDSRGNAQFIGEDRIDHTPKNETVTLKLGESFDVTVRRKQTEFKKLSGASAYNYTYEAAFVLEIKNAKPDAVTVKVVEDIPGDWKMIQQSQPHSKEASHLAVWQVLVPSDGAATLSWRVQVRF